MSSLLIDLGNSRIKWTQSESEGFLLGGVLAHENNQLNTQLETALRQLNLRLVHISSVARPEIRQQLHALLERLGVTQDWLVSPAQGLGLTNSYAQPHKLGIDRWLALAAAYANSGGKACCVIDSGTAITVDVCNARGQHQGGLIAPGPLALAQALKAHTALPMATDTLPSSLEFACDTEEALQYGALHAACGVIERAFDLAQKKHACATALLTGGGATALSHYLRIPHQIEPALVFQGLDLHAQEFQSKT
jgi:type III pantothenate kinase